MEHVRATRKCLKETGNREGDREEEARGLYIKRSAVAPDTASRQFSRALKVIKGFN
jgi:hypothetical protein